MNIAEPIDQAIAVLNEHQLPLATSWCRIAVADGSNHTVLVGPANLLCAILTGQATGKLAENDLSGTLVAIFKPTFDEKGTIKREDGKQLGKWVYPKCLNDSSGFDSVLKLFLIDDCNATPVVGSVANVLKPSGILAEQSLSPGQVIVAKLFSGKFSLENDLVLSLVDGNRSTLVATLESLDSYVLNTSVLKHHDDVYYLAFYHPSTRHGQYNSFHQTAFTTQIKRFKEGRPNALYALTQRIMVDKVFRHPVPIVVAPSSSGVPDTPLTKLCERLCNADHGCGIDASQTLLRRVPIQPAHQGGPRSEEIHLDTIDVQTSEFIDGRVVLLLDDVTTTGSTMRACEKLLQDAGALYVIKLALAKTYH